MHSYRLMVLVNDHTEFMSLMHSYRLMVLVNDHTEFMSLSKNVLYPLKKERKKERKEKGSEHEE